MTIFLGLEYTAPDWTQFLCPYSERSLFDKANHNCLIEEAGFHGRYGLIVTFFKVTTGHRFNLDFPFEVGVDGRISPEAGDIIVSQGEGFHRFPVSPGILLKLRPSVRRALEELVETATSLVRVVDEKIDGSYTFRRLNLEAVGFSPTACRGILESVKADWAVKD